MKKSKKNLVNLIAFAMIALFSGPTANAQSLTIERPIDQWPSRTIAVSPIFGAEKVPLVDFRLSSTADAMLVKSITVKAHWTSSAHTMYLFNGLTLISSAAAQNGQECTFNVNLELQKGMTVPYTIKADFGTETPFVSPSAWASVDAATFQLADGAIGHSSGSSYGNEMHFFGSIADYRIGAGTEIRMNRHTSGRASVTAIFPFIVTARGSTVAMPQYSDFVVRFTDLVSAETRNATATSVVTVPNGDLADGTTAIIVVTAMLTWSDIDPNGLYAARIQNIGWTAGSQRVLQSWGLEEMATPISNVSPTAMNGLSIIDSYFYDDGRSDGVNQFILTFILPKGVTAAIQQSGDMATWLPAEPGFGSGSIFDLRYGGRVMKAFVFAPKDAERGFYRIVETP